MEEVWKSLASNIPSAVAVIFTVWIMTSVDERRDIRREANAKLKADEDRAHELKIHEMWRDNFMMMNAKTDETYKLIAAGMKSHEEADQERYEKLGLTRDLLKMTRKRKTV